MSKTKKFTLSMMEYGIILGIFILFAVVMLSKLGSVTGESQKKITPPVSQQKVFEDLR